MGVNLDKPDRWKADISASVDMYNDWFMRFAPKAFRETRVQTTTDVEAALAATGNLRDLRVEVLEANPAILPTLRMSTCPPLAVDRLIGLAGVSSSMVKSMEGKKRLPPQMPRAELRRQLGRVADILLRMADPDIFVWLGNSGKEPSKENVHRAATVVADRLCGSVANPIIRNAQEKRQLAAIKAWLEARGYCQLPVRESTTFQSLSAGTFSFRMNVPVVQAGSGRTVNIPVDTVVMPKGAAVGSHPMFWEAKSAGDFTNTNKRRKEEAQKMSQLRSTYGAGVRFNLFLCGYFDSGYLGYEAAEGIDWVWEHRINDLELFGL